MSFVPILPLTTDTKKSLQAIIQFFPTAIGICSEFFLALQREQVNKTPREQEHIALREQVNRAPREHEHMAPREKVYIEQRQQENIDPREQVNK